MLLLLLVTSVAPAFAQQGAIKEIVVFGNERIDKRIILKEIKSKVGAPFAPETVREDIKAIYRLGYFRDVQVDVAETKGEIILTFAVIEKPYVANIVISGNSKLKQEEIEGVIEVKRDSVLEWARCVRASPRSKNSIPPIGTSAARWSIGSSLNRGIRQWSTLMSSKG
jgi:outer membrane protein insertion porin family